MTTRITTAHITSDQVDAAAAYWRDALIPAAKRLNGWRAAELFVNRTTGKCVIVAQWATEADLSASATSLQAEFAHFASFLAAPPTAEVYDLCVTA
jgi:hypothetical protein